MAISPREKRLAAAVGVLGAITLVWFAWQAYSGAVSLRETQLDAVQADIRKKQDEINRARREGARLTQWETQSLPRDRELARSHYQNWLTAELSGAKLKSVTVDPGRTTVMRDVYAKLPFTIRARGSLDQVVKWLASFYRADHLQQIHDLTLQPVGDGGELQLTAGIEALALNNAARRDSLNDKPSPRLSDADAVAAVKTIVERNFFAPYVPPPPPPPPPQVAAPAPLPPPAFDPSKYTFLTSIILVDARPQAWLNVRPTNQLLRLYVGDSISVGRFNGKLVRIGGQEIEIEADGKRRVVALGKSLEQAVELPPSGT